MTCIGKSIHMLLFIFCALQLSCKNSNGIDEATKTYKGVAMKAYNIGRYSIKLPTEYTLNALSQRLRECEIQEIIWRQGQDPERERAALWNERIAQIESQEPPSGINKPIMDMRQIKEVGRYAKGVFYYGDNISRDIGNWYILVDTGPIGLSLQYWGEIEEKEKMLRWILEIAKAYRSTHTSDDSSVANSFSLRYGTVVLPFIAQESTYARFVHQSLDLTLEIEMNDTHSDEPKGEGLLARTAAVIATGYATGVDIKRIRSKKRKVAGLDGEEEVDRMRDKYRTAISYGWRYAGKKDSGEYPEIVLRMESPDGNLEEKLKVWDAILDSMKPLYRQ